MTLLDLLGRRWTLRMLWELRDQRELGFRDLQRACGGTPPSSLSQRLAELCDAQLLQQTEEGAYSVTPLGRSLAKHLRPLDKWSQDWAAVTRK